MHLTKGGSLDEVGGWCYGMHIAEEINRSLGQGYNQPRYESFLVSDDPCAIERRMRSLQGGYTVKYSLFDEHEFRSSGMRGSNTSLGRTVHYNRQGEHYTLSKVQRIVSSASLNVRRIVFQELLDLSRGVLFHADRKEGIIEAEVLHSFSRSLLMIKDGRTIFEESSSDLYSEEEKHINKNIVNSLVKYYEQIDKTYPTSDWLIEGFWNCTSRETFILQLRPSLDDRPRLQSSMTHTTQNGSFEETGFVWGVFDNIKLYCKSNEGVQRKIVASSEWNFTHPNDNLPYKPETLLHFSCSNRNIVVRSGASGASRMSHEPWFLPPPEYRCNFCHLWIPRRVDDSVSADSVLMVSSDGNKARFHML